MWRLDFGKTFQLQLMNKRSNIAWRKGWMLGVGCATRRKLNFRPPWAIWSPKTLPLGRANFSCSSRTEQQSFIYGYDILIYIYIYTMYIHICIYIFTIYNYIYTHYIYVYIYTEIQSMYVYIYTCRFRCVFVGRVPSHGGLDVDFFLRSIPWCAGQLKATMVSGGCFIRTGKGITL